MRKFKIGDVVWNKSNTMYVITSYHVKCKIVTFSDSSKSDMVVMVLDGDNKGECFCVESSYFEVVFEDIEWV